LMILEVFSNLSDSVILFYDVFIIKTKLGMFSSRVLHG